MHSEKKTLKGKLPLTYNDLFGSWIDDIVPKGGILNYFIYITF